MTVPVVPAGRAADGDRRPTPLRVGLLHPYQLLTSGSGVYLVRVMRELLDRGHRLTLLSHDEHPERALALGRSGGHVDLAQRRRREPGLLRPRADERAGTAELGQVGGEHEPVHRGKEVSNSPPRLLRCRTRRRPG